MRRHLVLVFSMGLAVGLLGGCGSDDPPATTPDAGTQYTCGPTNCTGCCFGNVCQSGVTVAGCGKGGQACMACVKGQICNATQTCAIDPTSMWTVSPVRTQLRATHDGQPWTSDGGAPAVIVQLTCPGGTTPSKTDGYPSGQDGGVVYYGGACETTGRNLLRLSTAVALYQTNAPYSSPTSPRLVDSAYHLFTEAEVLDGGTVTLAGSSATSGMESTTLSVTQQP